jgi:putative transcriptional regulator
MTCHHPQDDILLSYTAGGLGESWSLAIASHLTFCPDCREAVAFAEEIGGLLLDNHNSTPLSNTALIKTEERIGEHEVTPFVTANNRARSSLPTPLIDYVGDTVEDLNWQSIGGGAYQFMISTNDNDQARLLRIPAGRTVPEHGHGGRELTLVLSGNFSDQSGKFAAGDLQDVAEDVTHQPVAGKGNDCICLVVTDAALQFKSFIPRLVQPFIAI